MFIRLSNNDSQKAREPGVKCPKSKAGKWS